MVELITAQTARETLQSNLEEDARKIRESIDQAINEGEFSCCVASDLLRGSLVQSELSKCGYTVTVQHNYIWSNLVFETPMSSRYKSPYFLTASEAFKRASEAEQKLAEEEDALIVSNAISAALECRQNNFMIPLDELSYPAILVEKLEQKGFYIANKQEFRDGTCESLSVTFSVN